MKGSRGQTSLDFAVGMSTLLLVFAFVLTFVPGVLSPFAASGQEETVTADRVADHLAEGLLAEPETPYVLDGACTVAFFDGTDPGDCAFDPTASLDERVGVSAYIDSDTPRQRVNVRLLGDTNGDGTETVLCEDGGDIVEDTGSCSPTFEIGPDPPSNRGSVVAARRVVAIDGRTVTLSVRVW